MDNNWYLGATFKHKHAPVSFTLDQVVGPEGFVNMIWNDGVKGSWEYSGLHTLAINSPEYTGVFSKNRVLKAYFYGQE